MSTCVLGHDCVHIEYVWKGFAVLVTFFRRIYEKFRRVGNSYWVIGGVQDIGIFYPDAIAVGGAMGKEIKNGFNPSLRVVEFSRWN